MSASPRLYWRRWLGGAALLLLGVVAISLWRVPSFASVRAAHVPSEAWLLDRHGIPLSAVRLDHQVRRLPWVRLDAVSPALVTAVLEAEDQRFGQHPGVDPLAVGAALRDGLSGRGWRGASTLTMQLATQLQGRAAKGRAPLRAKVRQAWLALGLGLRWSREEVLEAYLNTVTWRGESVGLAAATEVWFGKAPAQLREDEAVLLAALLRSPNAAPAAIAARACRIAHAVAARCTTLTVLAEQSLRTPHYGAIEPGLAPHLAVRLLRHPGERLVSTLDARTQRVAVDVLRGQLLSLANRRARDAAMIVADRRTGEVLAYVGSAGPDSGAPAFDAARGRRPAGSTLKPFLYAETLSQRLLTPASLLDDRPLLVQTSAGMYTPQNYDRQFRGLVSLRTALASSLNVPAVRTLQLLGPARLHGRLRELGYASLADDPEVYGLSLALGSAEVTLEEQVAAYRVLGNAGRGGPLLYRLTAGSDARTTDTAKLDPRAAWLVGSILSDRTARAATFGFEGPLATKQWTAVKTGTSTDLRDNWCLGWSTTHVVGVWLGNAEGDAMRDVTGVSGAAPAWAAMIDALGSASTRATAGPPPPSDIVARAVRFERDGEPPRMEWFIKGTESTKISVASPDLERPVITLPLDGEVFALDPEIPASRQQVQLASTAMPGGPALEWHVDGKRLAAVGEQTVCWPLAAGVHEIALVRPIDGEVLHAVHVTVRGLATTLRASGPDAPR